MGVLFILQVKSCQDTHQIPFSVSGVDLAHKHSNLGIHSENLQPRIFLLFRESHKATQYQLCLFFYFPTPTQRKVTLRDLSKILVEPNMDTVSFCGTNYLNFRNFFFKGLIAISVQIPEPCMLGCSQLLSLKILQKIGLRLTTTLRRLLVFVSYNQLRRAFSLMCKKLFSQWPKTLLFQVVFCKARMIKSYKCTPDVIRSQGNSDKYFNSGFIKNSSAAQAHCLPATLRHMIK